MINFPFLMGHSREHYEFWSLTASEHMGRKCLLVLGEWLLIHSKINEQTRRLLINAHVRNTIRIHSYLTNHSYLINHRYLNNYSFN